jgi:hypothetical protein
MRVAFSFLFLLVVVALNGGHAFAPLSPMTRAGGVNMERRMASFSPQDQDNVKNDEDAVATTMKAPAKGLTPIQKVFWVLSDATSYAIIAVGASVSLGFMLNVFGFAYQFDWDHGLEVDTIGKIREVNQFRAAVASSSRPPSVLPK